MSTPLERGAVLWVDLDPTRGREQRGTRPALVVSSAGYLGSVPGLVVVLPVTSVDRSWPHHVRLGGSDVGLTKASFAMTEQPRTIAREGVARRVGVVDGRTMTDVDRWLRDFIGI